MFADHCIQTHHKNEELLQIIKPHFALHFFAIFAMQENLTHLIMSSFGERLK